ncbi:hypothetical protein DLAC_08989 [Tieghemostelium lacteum]|uniref:Uncharacterized protein n=1 Tax=Tieghemostelium lacteum TaxID=361077 RepID=A0A151Z8W1_TIELA|nr:hypothetical protein DLAC_08989 [Tieghemostelium lacteum]|eukprot:KYQ90371.1 hypothetical protein DLAC_08989 [Tieghemostelium lacteum]
MVSIQNTCLNIVKIPAAVVNNDQLKPLLKAIKSFKENAVKAKFSLSRIADGVKYITDGGIDNCENSAKYAFESISIEELPKSSAPIDIKPHNIQTSSTRRC